MTEHESVVEEDAGEGQSLEQDAPEAESPASLSDEELDEILKIGGEPEEDEPQQPTEQSETPETQAPAAQVTEPAKAPTVDDLQARLAANEERLAKQEKMLAQQEQFIRHRGTELGAVRKEKLELERQIAQLRAGLNDRYAEDPAQATEDHLAIKAAERRVEQLSQVEDEESKEQQAREIFARFVPADAGVGVEDLAQCLLDDGLPPEIVARFKQNPFRGVDPQVPTHLAKRARAERALRQIVPAATKLAKENDDLRAEIARLKKSGPDNVLRKVSQELRKTPTLAAGAPSSKADSLPAKPLYQLTDAELDSLLARQE